MSKSLAVLALTLPAANAAYHWTKGNKICGGLIVPCVDAFSCSATAIGPCESDADPTAYLESAFVGMGYVDSTKFLDAATGKTTTDATTYKVVTPTGPGFRDFKAEFKMDGDKQKFGYSMYVFIYSFCVSFFVVIYATTRTDISRSFSLFPSPTGPETLSEIPTLPVDTSVWFRT